MPMLPPLVGELRVRSTDVKTKFHEAMKLSDELAKKTSGDNNASGSTFEKLGMTGKIALSAVGGGMSALIGKSAEMAADYQEKMTLLVTGAGEAQSNIANVSNGILDMAPKVATSSSALADGMYMIESAGYHGSNGLQVLQAAAEGAKVGNANLSATSDALTTIMKDYSIPTSQAADVTSKLVATVANGKTHMEDLAGSMSHVLPFASGLGISLDDTMGAMATMTGEGVQAADAATYLKFTMMALANETPKGKKALDEVGLSSTQVAGDLKNKGLNGTLAEITDAIGKKFPQGSAEYNAALADIVGGTRGMAAALALTGQNASTYIDNVHKIAEAHAGADGSVEGFQDAMGDLNNKLAGVRETFNSLAIKLGTALMPMFTAVATKAQEFLNYLTKHKEMALSLIAVIGGVVAVLGGLFIFSRITNLLKDVSGGWELLTKAMSANPVIRVIMIITALVSALVFAYNNVGWFKDMVNTAWAAIQVAVSATVSWFVTYALPVLKTVWDGISTGAVWLWKNVLVPAWTGIQIIAKAAVDWFMNTALPVLKVVFQGIGEFAGNAFKGAQVVIGVFLGWWQANVAPLINAGIELIRAAFAKGQEIFATFSRAAGPHLQNVTAAFQFFVNWLRPAWEALWKTVKAIWDFVGPTLFAAIKAGWEVLSAAIKFVWDTIVTIVNGALAVIHGVIDVVTGIIQGNWSKVWQGISEIFSGVWNTIVGILQNAVSFVQSVLEAAWGYIVDVTTNAWNNVQSFFSDAWTNMERSVSDGVANVISFISGLPGQIMGILSGAGSWLFDVGRNIIQGLIDGISSMIGTIGKTLTDGINGAVQGFKDVLGIHSPSWVFHELGQHTMQGYINGIASMSGMVGNAVGAAVPMPAFGGSPSQAGGAPGGYIGAPTASGGGGLGGTVNNIYVTAQTNADPTKIAGAIGYELLLRG